MDRYIRLDAHASSCTLAVLSPSGKRLGSQVVETNARCLIEAVRQIPAPRHICLEEGTLSGWLYEVLSPHAEEGVVAAVSESRGSKDGQLDAFGLADDLRLGAIKRKVYEKRGRLGALNYRAKGYRCTRGDVVRVKNRLKSLYRSRGIQVAGKAVCTASRREGFVVKLPKDAKPLAELLYEELDALAALWAYRHAGKLPEEVHGGAREEANLSLPGFRVREGDFRPVQVHGFPPGGQELPLPTAPVDLRPEPRHLSVPEPPPPLPVACVRVLFPALRGVRPLHPGFRQVRVRFRQVSPPH